MQRKVNRLIRLATSFVILGLVPLLAAGTALTGHFRSNMERVVLDDIGRMVSYGGSNTEAVLEECSSLTKHIYDVSTDDGMFLYQILKFPGLGREERKMEITLLLSDFLDRDSRLRSVYFKDRKGQIYYATRNAYKVLDEDAFRYWTGKEDEKGDFSVLPAHMDDYFQDSGSQVITFRRSYQDMDVSRLQSALSDIDLGFGASFYIMDDSGACIYRVDTDGSGNTADSMASLLPSMNQETGSLLGDGTYVVYKRLEPYGWTVAVQAAQDRVLVMESTIRYTAVFLGAVFLAFLCLYSYFPERIHRP